MNEIPAEGGNRDDTFDQLVRDHAKLMAAAIRRVCGRRFHQLVPDVQQEVYLALWKRLAGGKEIRHPTSYLYKVALTTALSVTRKVLPALPLDEGEEVEAPPEEVHAFANLLPVERARLLSEVLQQLEPEQARAMRAYLVGFSHKEVAELYGWSESVARHRIYRSIDQLKATMGRDTYDGTTANTV